MRVYLIPRWLENPYLELLAATLRAAGIDVRMPRFLSVVPLLGVVAIYGRPDLIHLHWQHPFLVCQGFGGRIRTRIHTLGFLAQLIVLRRLGVRFVWTVHNVSHHEGVETEWEIRASKRLANLADAILVHCPAAIPIVASAYDISPQRLQVVPLGTYTESTRYPPAVPRARARELLGLPADDRIVLFFGGVRAYKGLDVLLDVFAAIDQEHTRLVLLGKPLPSALGESLSAKARLDPRVDTCFVYVEDSRLALFLDACDAVVLPYCDSLTSSAAILAASRQRCVIVPRLGCMQELPEDAAFKYTALDPLGLQNALEQAIGADGQELDEMGLRAYSFVQQHPWTLVAERTVRIYEQALLAQNSPAGKVGGMEE